MTLQRSNWTRSHIRISVDDSVVSGSWPLNCDNQNLYIVDVTGH